MMPRSNPRPLNLDFGIGSQSWVYLLKFSGDFNSQPGLGTSALHRYTPTPPDSSGTQGHLDSALRPHCPAVSLSAWNVFPSLVDFPSWLAPHTDFTYVPYLFCVPLIIETILDNESLYILLLAISHSLRIIQIGRAHV